MKEKLFIGVFWLGAAKLIINFLALISTIILARLLTPEDFGLVAIVLALLAIIEAVTDLSLASALIHIKTLSEEHFDTAWSLNFARGILMAVIFASGSNFIAAYYHDQRLINIMLIISLSILVSGLANPKIVVLTKSLVFWQEFVVTVSQKIMSVIVSVAFAIYFKSYWALVAGVITSQIVGVFVSYLIIPYKPKFTLIHIKDIWSFSVWLTLGKIVNTINWKFDQLIIGSYLGNKTLGFYTVGDNLAGMPTREAIQPLENTLFPGFTHLSHDPSRLKNAYVRAQSLITSIALPLGIGFAIIAQPLISVLMGEKWLQSVQVIQIISGVYVLQTIGSQAQPLAMALGYTKAIFKRDLFMFVVRLPVIIVSLLYFGLIGVLIGRVFTGSLSLLINMWLIKKMLALNILEQFKNNIRSILSVAAMCIAITAVNHWVIFSNQIWTLLLDILVGLLVYVSTHFILWIVSNRPTGPETELLQLINKKFKKTNFKV